VDGTGDHHFKHNNPDLERQYSMFSLIYAIQKTEDLIVLGKRWVGGKGIRECHGGGVNMIKFHYWYI
jgi:hypothetical protein